MKTFTVKQLIAVAIATSGKTQTEIAREIGIDQPNLVSMLKSGRSKLPINRVRAFANAVGIDPKPFMSRVLQEYMPETWAELQAIYGISD